MNKYIVIGVLVTAAFFVYQYFSPNWSLFYYPDGCLGCVDKWVIKLDAYKSEEECRDAGYTINKARSYLLDDTFECGYKCKQVDETGYMCKETVDF